jgi:DtxR family transcriptional regulator, Mn-dependent transcriptional regulator
MQYSHTEENYIKSIYALAFANVKEMATSTNHIAAYLCIKPATVTSMLQKLNEKKLIIYKPYSKVTLTKSGKLLALNIIRKHRLWEVFLVNQLGFTWDKVHDVAEQLEHIQSAELIEKLDAYLQYPTIDPHGDPIPTALGEVAHLKAKKLNEISKNKVCKVVAVNDNNIQLLQYLSEIGIGLGTHIKMIEKIEIADVFVIEILNTKINISFKTAEHISVI